MEEVALAQVDAHVVAEVPVVDGVEAHQVPPLEPADAVDALEPFIVALLPDAALQDVLPGLAVAIGRETGAVSKLPVKGIIQ